MIYNVEELLNKYSNLHYRSFPDSKFDVIEGDFVVNAVSSGVSIELDYSIYAKLYHDENTPPIIKETSGKVNPKFSHINPDGALCLAVDAEIMSECTTPLGFDVMVWFETFVIPYFYSYEYFKKNGCFPFGERKHGAAGILEYYQQMFDVDDSQKALSLLKYLVFHKYRGHLLCPCGSGKIIRKCHSKALWNAQATLSKVILFRDYKIIKEYYHE